MATERVNLDDIEVMDDEGDWLPAFGVIGAYEAWVIDGMLRVYREKRRPISFMPEAWRVKGAGHGNSTVGSTRQPAG